MADWGKPTIISNYVTFVDEVKNRDIDAISLCKFAMPVIPTGAVKLLRAPVKFQEWDGTTFVDQTLSVEGGGSGSSSAAGARTNFGLGTMAVQNSNAIAVTGGSIANITSSGSLTHNGQTVALASNNGAGLIVYGSLTGAYAVHIIGGNGAGVSFGLYVQAGTTNTDNAFTVNDRAGAKTGLVIRGNMVAEFLHRIVIPVGIDLWAT